MVHFYFDFESCSLVGIKENNWHYYVYQYTQWLSRLDSRSQGDTPRGSVYVPMHSCVRSQKPAKNWTKKVVKSTDHTYACSSLTNFQYVKNQIIGTGNYVNLLKLAWKNSWNRFNWTYFQRVLAWWNPCAMYYVVAPSLPALHTTIALSILLPGFSRKLKSNRVNKTGSLKNHYVRCSWHIHKLANSP